MSRRIQHYGHVMAVREINQRAWEQRPVQPTYYLPGHPKHAWAPGPKPKPKPLTASEWFTTLFFLGLFVLLWLDSAMS